MNAVEFLQALIQEDTSNPPGNESKVAALLAERCKESGLPYEITDLGHSRSNLEIRLKGEESRELFFCGHMDTVLPGEQKWDYPPFSANLSGHQLYGRGAADMKSGLAAMFLAVESLFLEREALPHDVVFLATAGEEVDSYGAQKYLEEKDLSSVAGMVIGEPTDEKIAVGHKGALWVEILTIGKTAHGAMPHEGINAIERMRKVMEMLDDLRVEWKVTGNPLGESSLSINKMDGGLQTNVIPDQCRIYVDIRTIPPQSHDELLVELEEKLREMFDDDVTACSMEVRLNRPGILTDKSSSIIQTARDIHGNDTPVYGVPYYTDAAILNPESSIPTLIYGPGNELLAHQPNEFVDTRAYLRAIEFYRQLAASFHI